MQLFPHPAARGSQVGYIVYRSITKLCATGGCTERTAETGAGI